MSDSKKAGNQPTQPASVYGTQQPASMNQRASVPERSIGSPGDSAFRTMSAPSLASLADAPPRVLPSQSSIRHVTKTYGGDYDSLGSVTSGVRSATRQTTNAATEPTHRASGRPNSSRQGSSSQRMPEETSIPPRSEQVTSVKTPGRSTWNLRIRKRGVAGHISGIINQIPDDPSNAQGLQSAFAAADDTPEYEILGELGAGNMGVVYRARQTSLNRNLAIKTLKPDSPNIEHDQAMFVSEAVVTSNLVHPNIVPIHDLGRTSDGKLFYSMKQVSGKPWNETIREFRVEENLDVFMKLCDAVAFAHSRGVINRDLKPENVVIGDYGEVMVLDWGLAITNERFAQNHSVIVEFRGGAGTPVYMPPELADEDISKVGVHSDIYLLGAILFEILEGYPPHLLRSTWEIEDPTEQLNAVIYAVIQNQIETDVVNEGELMQIARKALSTRPQDRYSSTEELQEAIREYRITGRAEELMQAVESKSTTSYAKYQTAIALYEEALRKWPNNRRAQNGDRAARLAYAELAHKKGDIDLGLQIIPGDHDHQFAGIRKKLNRTRQIRAMIRGTWGLAIVSAAALAIVSTIYWSKAENANQELIGAYGDVATAKENAEEERKQATAAKDEATTARNEAETAKAEADKAAARAKRNLALAEEAAAKQEKAEIKLTETKSELEEKATELDSAQKLAASAKLEAAKAAEEAKRATKMLVDARIRVEEAKQGEFKAIYSGYIERADAKEEIRSYDEMVPLMKNALALAEQHSIVSVSEITALRKRLKAAEGKLEGNTSVRHDTKMKTAAISPDGTTVLMSSESELTLYSKIATNGILPKQSVRLTLPEGKLKSATVSNSGEVVCAVGTDIKCAWLKTNTGYKELQLAPFFPKSEFGGKAFRKCLISNDSRHLYFVGDDSKITLEIYALDNGRANLLFQRQLIDQDTGSRAANDVVLLKDESALLIAYMDVCRSFPMKWNAGAVEIEERAGQVEDKVFPVLRGLQNLGNGGDRFKPKLLSLSADGSLLALVAWNRILVLPRQPTDTPGAFPFASPDQLSDLDERTINCEYNDRVTALAFSADNQRMITSANRYLQIWDRSGNSFVPCKEPGLYANHSLAGHANTISNAAFLGEAGNRIVSVATDSNIRLWDVAAYEDFVVEMQTLVRSFKESREARKSSRLEQRSIAQPPLYILAAAPQPPQNALRFRQGRKVFSAEFSHDGSRVLVGANDLAAHAFNSETGEKTLTASMQNPRDLFFSPDRNNFLEGHIPEIVSIQFLPPNGDLLLTSDYFGSVSAWDAKNDEDGIGFEKSRLLPEEPSCEIAVSKDGKWLIAGGVKNDGVVNLADSKDEYFAVIWKTADIVNSSAPAPHMLLRGQHPFQVTAAGFSPDGSKAVTAGRRGKFVVWDVMTGNVIATAVNGHKTDGVSGVFFSSEDELISAGFDGNVFKWKIDGSELTATEIKRPEGTEVPDFIVRLRPSPDGKGFITSDLSKEADDRVYTVVFNHWSELTGWSTLPFTITASEDLGKPYRHDISWSQDGSEVLYVHDEEMFVLDSKTWKVTGGMRLPGSTKAIRGAFAPIADGKKRVATFDGRFAHLWSLNDGTHIAEFRSHASKVTAAFSSDQKYVVTGSESVRVFDSNESSFDHGRTVFRMAEREAHQKGVASVDFSPVKGDYRIASVDVLGGVKTWEWSPQENPPELPIFEAASISAVLPQWAEEFGLANYIKWSDDASLLVAVRQGRISLWNMDGPQPTEIRVSLPDGYSGVFNCVDFSSDGTRLAAGGTVYREEVDELQSFAIIWKIEGNEVRPVAVTDQQERHRYEARVDRQLRGITAIVFDDEQDEVITGGADSQVIRWQLSEPDVEKIQTLGYLEEKEGRANDGFTDPHRAGITCLDVSSQGRLVSTDEAGWIVVWPVTR